MLLLKITVRSKYFARLAAVIGGKICKIGFTSIAHTKWLPFGN
jgi:hypothetical protein